MFATGELKIVADLLDGDLANVHMGTVALGIRHVACVPLRMVRYLDRADMKSETKNIGVLYLDSREKGSLLAPHTRTALDTLATEAGVAIENARLYRETLEKARIEHELKIAAEIQRALLPEGTPQRQLLRGERHVGAGAHDRRRLLRLLDMPDGQFGVPGRRRRRQGSGGGAADVEDPRHLLGVRVESATIRRRPSTTSTRC